MQETKDTAPYIDISELKKNIVANTDADINVIEEAIKYALNSHKNQLRLSGAPYIIHPIAVAFILAGWKRYCRFLHFYSRRPGGVDSCAQPGRQRAGRHPGALHWKRLPLPRGTCSPAAGLWRYLRPCPVPALLHRRLRNLPRGPS